MKFTKTMGAMLCNLIDVRIGNMKQYLVKLSESMHTLSVEYWKQFGHTTIPDERDEVVNEAKTTEAERNSGDLGEEVNM